MVDGMAPGSVIVDLAAERGGNCELTRAGETIVDSGVTIIGRINLASTVPYHASQMYARNITAFLAAPGERRQAQPESRRTKSSARLLLTRGGEVVNARVREFFRCRRWLRKA